MASSYVFYFGSAVGDSASDDTTTFLVNSTDEQPARNNPKSTLGTPATITDVNGFNRNGNVNSTDQQTSRNNGTSALSTALKFLNVGAGGPFTPAVESGRVALLAIASPGENSGPLGGNGDRGIASALADSSQSTEPLLLGVGA